ncbi:Calcium-binding EF hand family protein [Musa troglodytarum]|uniref:Calcium-binding EF hand family protein n=1 Tax=Musa troglodytarum TaxID=320322 RepID=A0A9E7HBG6_9LILI|nr:Calcium-binding EF hand family protein [Musa troglodytarum]
MEKPVYLAEPEVVLLFLNALLSSIMVAIQNLSLRSMSFLHTYVACCACLSAVPDEQHPVSSAAGEARGGDCNLRIEDVQIVLGRMGLGEQQLQEKMEGFDHLPDLFADEEPSLEELKQAFSVFDENGDGFIDEVELQTVLAKLGIAEASDLDACRRMIAAHDRNRDGRIDLIDFVKFMEIRCYCSEASGKVDLPFINGLHICPHYNSDERAMHTSYNQILLARSWMDRVELNGPVMLEHHTRSDRSVKWTVRLLPFRSKEGRLVESPNPRGKTGDLFPAARDSQRRKPRCRRRHPVSRSSLAAFQFTQACRCGCRRRDPAVAAQPPPSASSLDNTAVLSTDGVGI